MKRRIPVLLCTILLSQNPELQADTALLALKGGDTIALEPLSVDFVRQNLIHIFDSSNFHQLNGGHLRPKSDEEIAEQLKRLKSGTFIELNLDEPVRIVVENMDMRAIRMWVSIRESDGFVYDWIFEQPNGKRVALSKARGELIVQFAPYVLHLLKENGDGRN